VLKNIDPLLGADLLGHLAAMGHGDVLAVVDRNFPAASTARRLVTLPGVDAPTAVRAILSLFPVDSFVEPAVLRMGPVGDCRALRVLPAGRAGVPRRGHHGGAPVRLLPADQGRGLNRSPSARADLPHSGLALAGAAPYRQGNRFA
jgi:RbsD / FucU transport protein family